MGDIVYTALHKLDWSKVPAKTKDLYLNRAAKYFVDDDVVQVITRGDAWKSIKALVDANLLKLPFNPLMIEYSATGKFRWFIVLEDLGDEFRAQAIFRHMETDVTYYSSRDVRVTLTNTQFQCDGVRTDQDANAIVCAICMALLFLNTKGIEKQVRQHDGLNKARAKRGKPTVQPYTTIRIGTVYDRDGKGTKIAEGTGRTMPVHLRSAYTRAQHFGPNNSEVKQVYIEACIVNYRPESGADMPSLVAKVARKVKM
jgi:hypothetical protein